MSRVLVVVELSSLFDQNTAMFSSSILGFSKDLPLRIKRQGTKSR